MDTLVSTADTVMTSTVETEVVYGKYSKHLLFNTLDHYYVSPDFGMPLALYLTRGYTPGSCLTALLANDAWNFITRSHPSNQVEDLKNLTKWIMNYDRTKAWSGSYKKVEAWCKLTDMERNAVLVEQMLVYPHADETWKLLRGDPLAPLSTNYYTRPYNLDLRL